MIHEEDIFKIGQFGKPHGIKGEITLITQSDVLEETDEPYIICDMDGIFVPFFTENWRYKTDSTILVKLDGVDDEASAREFTHKEVYFSLDEVDEDDDLVGDMTWDNFIGYLVSDQKLGELGPVTAIDESTINVLMHIDHQGDELLFPAAEELIISADHDKKLLVVNLPEGLLDL